MKLKYLWMCATALTLGFASCSSDDEKEEAVGISAATITPAGSTVAYKIKVNADGAIDNRADSVAWDVTDAQLAEAVLKVTTTIGCTATCNGEEVTSEGVTVDATAPVVVSVTNGKKEVSKTITVLRAKTATEGFVKKATLNTTNLVWRDVTFWKGKFYAFTVTNEITDTESGTSVEKYELSSSVDGMTFTPIDYVVTNVEADELSSDYQVIGGEGARLIPFGDKLYVLTGMRTLGTDVNGNEKEQSTGWIIGPAISKWRGFVTSDGQNFTTISEVIMNGETELPVAIHYSYNNPYGNAFVFKDNIFLIGGFTVGFGMVQAGRNILQSTDGTTWKRIAAVDGDGASIGLPYLGSSAFVLNDKIYLVGGFSSFVSSSQVSKNVYTSEDGTVWKNEGEAVGLPCIYQAQVISNGSVAYLIGGESLDEETRALNTKVYRTEDGLNWTEVEAPSAFLAGRFPAACMVGNAVWMFCGNTTISSGNYAAPVATDIMSGDVWNTQLK